MPLQVMTVETRTKQTEVVELETPEDRGSRSYKESGGHVFTEHLEGQSYLDIYVAKLKSDDQIIGKVHLQKFQSVIMLLRIMQMSLWRTN